MKKRYNYIIQGAGASGLWLAYWLHKEGLLDDKTLLIVECDEFKQNDRTWCFWEEKNETWDEIVTKKWNLALYADPTRLVEIDLAPKKYNQIRSVDFYNFVLDEISKQDNITFENQKVLEVEEFENHITVQTNSEIFSCDQLFNSILNPFEVEKSIEKEKDLSPEKEEKIVKGVKKSAKKYGKNITSKTIKKKK